MSQKNEEKPTTNEAALDWEASKTLMQENSEKRAWFVVKILTALCLLLGVTIALMMPLKQVVPYLVRVNDVTGATDLVTRLDIKPVAFDEVMDRYWLANYTRARENYDWYTLQRDYDLVGMLSSKPVAESYASLFQGENSLEKRYGNKFRVVVKIVSVVPNGRGIATVRFIKELYTATNLVTPIETTKWVATIGYEYLTPSFISENERLMNPFGFRVNSYRFDPESF